VYLHPEQQERDYKELSDAIGWKKIQRRNIGFVYAYQNGADIVATVDDDNIPYENWGKDLHVGKKVERDFYETDNLVFDPLSVTNNSNLWHRGYPIECIPTKNNVTLTIEQVSGVKGTEDDTIETSQKNFKDQFEVNDFVIGPRAKFGARAIGYVSKVNSTSTPNTNQVYQTQELVITGATELDAIAFRSLGAGATLTLGSFKVEERKYVDDNSGKVVSGGFYNGYRYLQEIDIVNGECIGNTKVERKGSEPLLTVLETENVAEDIGGRQPKFVRNTVVGRILTPKTQKAPPPNFKAAKLEDLIGDFTTFFSAIDTLSNTLRNIAGDSSTALDEIIAYLDSKIAELDEINTALQDILKLFTDGLPKGGVYVLTVPPTVGGNDLIKSALSSAENRPPDDLDFAVGFFMMGGGPSMKVLNKLLNSA
jgi:hypothetical protein